MNEDNFTDEFSEGSRRESECWLGEGLRVQPGIACADPRWKVCIGSWRGRMNDGGTKAWVQGAILSTERNGLPRA